MNRLALWSRFRPLFILLGLVLTLPIAGSAAAGVTAAQTGQKPVATISAEHLPSAVSRANDGDTILVEGGVFHGSLEIDKTLTLIGQGWPVLDGEGQGTVLKLNRPGTTIQGFVIRNSGDSLDQENSGIAVEAPDSIITGNRFVDTLFGVYLREADGSVVSDNHITGMDLEVPRRGDAIRVWFSNDVVIENNRAEGGRDVVLWYSERLTVRGNDVQNGRYGLHFMYCDDALIEGNRLLNNSVGAFLMYSRRMTMQHNTVAGNRGPSGYGIGLKDMDDAQVIQNLFLDNRAGAYLDGSPREVDSTGLFQGNVFAYNDIGVEMLPSVRHNVFFANSFVENEEQVAITGGGQPGENAWTDGQQGNYWSDYAGFDANGDGRGDIPYKAERFFEDLMRQEPALRLFLYSPATDALDLAAKAFPVVKPQPKLTDELPLTAPVIPGDAPPLPAVGQGGWLWSALIVMALSGLLIGLPRLNNRRYRFPASSGQQPAGAQQITNIQRPTTR